MAQEGRGNRSSLPASFFDVDEFDAHWQDDVPGRFDGMREPSLMPEPPSEVQPTGKRQEIDVRLEEPAFPEEMGDPGFEDSLPLVHPDADHTAPTRRGSALISAVAAAEPEHQEDDDEDGGRATSPGDPLLYEVRDRYAMGDYSGALVIAEKILSTDSRNVQAQRYADNCLQVLQQMYCAKLGPLDRRLEVAVSADRLRWLSLDHRAGFMLSLIDGASSVEEVLDISGMPRFEALRTLCDLLDQNVIKLSR